MSERVRSSKRPYTLRRRAERQADTRRRIVEAAVELHGRLGPLATSVAAVARRAGVQRLTVYRHFPSEKSLTDACTARFFGRYPAPQPRAWRVISDPRRRLERALTELYAYWRKHEAIVANVARDYRRNADRVGHGLALYLGGVRRVLEGGWPASGRRRAVLRAALGHAIDVLTWRSLTREHGLTDREAAALMLLLVTRIGRSERTSR